MGRKARFKPKAVEITEKPKLKLVKGKNENPLSDVPDFNPVENLPPPKKEVRSLSLSKDKLERRMQVLDHINDLYQDTHLSLNQLFTGFLDIVLKSMDSTGGSIWIYNSVNEELECQVVSGKERETQKGKTLKLGKGIVGWVAEHKRSTLSTNPKEDRRYSRLDKDIAQHILAAPLIYGDELIGVIEIFNKSSDEEVFAEDDRYFLEDLVTPVAMHIKSSRLIEEQNGLVSRLENFKSLHELFSSTLELDKLLELVLSKAISLIDAEVGSIWITEENGEGIECITAEGPTKDKVIGVKVKRGMGIVGWVEQSQEPIIVEDCSQDSRFSKTLDKKIEFETESMICVPLVVKGESIGAIQIINKKGTNLLFNRNDLELMILFAGSAGMYIKNAKLFCCRIKS